MNPTEWTIFGILTLSNIWLSWWLSLKHKRYHGIFRLIAFECIILLVICQYPVWFRDPFTWYQSISWILLAGSLLVAIFGFQLFYKHGQPEDQMEETTHLIKTGLYRYIRHPLYLSLILGGFGIMMKDPEWPQIIMSLINFIAMYLTGRVEEVEMIRKFGKEYASYMKETKMFFPYIL